VVLDRPRPRSRARRGSPVSPEREGGDRRPCGRATPFEHAAIETDGPRVGGPRPTGRSRSAAECGVPGDGPSGRVRRGTAHAAGSRSAAGDVRALCAPRPRGDHGRVSQQRSLLSQRLLALEDGALRSRPLPDGGVEIGALRAAGHRPRVLRDPLAHERFRSGSLPSVLRGHRLGREVSDRGGSAGRVRRGGLDRRRGAREEEGARRAGSDGGAGLCGRARPNGRESPQPERSARRSRVAAAVRSEPASGGQPPSEERGGIEKREALGVGPQRTER
jgi:hypothetical protein